MNAQVGGRGIDLPIQTSGLDVVCSQVHVPAALTPEIKPVLIVQEDEWESGSV
jgi:hypothetical protein